MCDKISVTLFVECGLIYKNEQFPILFKIEIVVFMYFAHLYIRY